MLNTSVNGSAAEKPTSGSEWRKEREVGVLFHFPSGKKAMVRPISTQAFLLYGSIPDLLSGIVAKLLEGGDEAIANFDTEDLKQLEKLRDIFCRDCLVTPHIVDDPQADDEISIRDLVPEDKEALFAFMGAPASALAAFRPQQNPIVDVVDDQPGDPHPAKRSRRSR